MSIATIAAPSGLTRTRAPRHGLDSLLNAMNRQRSKLGEDAMTAAEAERMGFAAVWAQWLKADAAARSMERESGGGGGARRWWDR